MARYGTLNRTGLSAYRSYLIDHYKPSTVNLRILSMNKYLDAAGLRNLQMKPLKLPKELFLDRIISMEDYQRFKRALFLPASVCEEFPAEECGYRSSCESYGP